MRKILVTGAAGFIGSHLLRFLQRNGEQAAGLDNFNSYYDKSLKEARVRELAKIGAPVEAGDICDQEALNRWIAHHRPTHLVHLAAQAGVRYSLVNPQAYVKTNIEGFLNVLEACRNNPGLRLVYASSSSVYGLNAKIPFSVEDPTDRQASFYGVTKKSNELMAANYHHLFGIPATGLRFFTVYGPWGRPDMAYYHFTESIMEGRPIDLYNEGQMERDFTYIDDIVEGIYAALNCVKGCNLYNLGNNRPVKLERFVEILEEAIGKKAVRRYLPMQAGDVVTTYADIDLSSRELGFSPKTSLEEGLPLFVDWYKRYHNKG